MVVSKDNKDNGWIKLHRRLLVNPIVHKPKYCHLWITLLLKAAHTETSFIWNREKQVIRPGQVLTGREKLSEATGIKPSTIENILNYLEDEQQIEQQKTQKFRIITIKNWEKYQFGKKLDSKVDNRVTTDGHIQEGKEGKEVKKYSQNSNEFRLSSLLFSEIRKRKPDYKEPNLQQWSVHIDRMIRLDNRKPDRIEAVISWCQQDSPKGERGFGWQNNILSTATLREKFDKLELAMQASQKQRQPCIVKFESDEPSAEFLRRQLDDLQQIPKQERTPKDRAEIQRLQACCERVDNDRASTDKTG